MNQSSNIIFERLLELLADKLAGKIAQEQGRFQPRLLTVEQAALYLGRTKDAVQHMVAVSKVPTVRTDRRVFIDRSDLDRWIEEHKDRI